MTRTENLEACAEILSRLLAWYRDCTLPNDPNVPQNLIRLAAIALARIESEEVGP